MRVKTREWALGLANVRPPGSAKFANAPPPGLTWRANALQLLGGGGGGGGCWALVELTDALHTSRRINWVVIVFKVASPL